MSAVIKKNNCGIEDKGKVRLVVTRHTYKGYAQKRRERRPYAQRPVFTYATPHSATAEHTPHRRA